MGNGERKGEEERGERELLLLPLPCTCAQKRRMEMAGTLVYIGFPYTASCWHTPLPPTLGYLLTNVGKY